MIAQSMAFFRNLSDYLRWENKDLNHALTEANLVEVERDLYAPIDVKGHSLSHPNVWVSLLLHLAQLLMDDRVEVRHSMWYETV